MFIGSRTEVFGVGEQRVEKVPHALDADGLLVQNLLNCVLREMPEQIRLVGCEEGAASAKFLNLTFLATKREFIFHVATPASMTGVYEYLGKSYFRGDSGVDWKKLTGLLLSDFIFQELGKIYTHLREPDFIPQVQDSFRVTQLIVDSAPVLDSLKTFLDSEQSVTFGHPFHPSPKSRTGFSEDEIRAYSPEFGRGFQLHYFGVKRSHLVQESLLEREAVDYVNSIDLKSLGTGRGGDEFVPIPVHPWEARYLLGLKEVREGLTNNLLLDLGPNGAQFFATSSVRTLFSPEQSFFYKMSLHVRVTNCIRRNVISEMRSAVELTRLLRRIQKYFTVRHPSFRWLEEPAFLSVCLTPNGEGSGAVGLGETEGFGMILRESLTPLLEKGEVPIVTAALFGNQSRGRHYLSQWITQSGLSPLEWFSYYLRVLLPPVLDLYFRYGLMSEPHLQNIVVCLSKGVPTKILLRDLDNFRLIQGEWGALNLNSPELLKDLVFEKNEAWNRFVYCLIVNHLNETIYSLSRCCQNGLQMREGINKNEKLLWDCLKQQLLQYLYGCDHQDAQELIGRLLEGNSLPAKGNLVTRFRRSVDRNAIYFEIPNPLNPNCAFLRTGD